MLLHSCLLFTVGRSLNLGTGHAGSDTSTPKKMHDTPRKDETESRKKEVKTEGTEKLFLFIMVLILLICLYCFIGNPPKHSNCTHISHICESVKYVMCAILHILTL